MSLHLKGNYIHYAMCSVRQRLLRFLWQGQHFQFKEMQFGLVKNFYLTDGNIGRCLKKKEIQVFMYLDDQELR